MRSTIKVGQLPLMILFKSRDVFFDKSHEYNSRRIKLIQVDKNAKARSDGEAYIVTEKGKVLVEIGEG